MLSICRYYFKHISKIHIATILVESVNLNVKESVDQVAYLPLASSVMNLLTTYQRWLNVSMRHYLTRHRTFHMVARDTNILQ